MQFNHKTYKTCKTMNNKSKEKRMAARNRVAAREAAGWRASPNQKMVLWVLLVL